MDIAKLQIRRDLERLLIPIKFHLNGYVLLFEIEPDAFPYTIPFHFKLVFPHNYPFSSPKLYCLTRTFHPNIDENGNTCLKVLREGWMPSYDVNSIITSLLCSFALPTGEDALNTEAGDLLENDYEEFVRRVKEAHRESRSYPVKKDSYECCSSTDSERRT